MAVDFKQIGLRLKAHRLGQGLTPEEAADRLGVSRAALYNYERGSTPIKVETLERIAEVLGVSLASLLGVGTEYFSTVVSYLERLRQIEQVSERITLFYEPLTFLLTSKDFSTIFRQMLIEGLPATLDSDKVRREIDQIDEFLKTRHHVLEPGGPAIACILGLTAVKRLVRTGLIGTFALPDAVRLERRELAYREVERTAKMMEEEPLGLQIGVVEDTVPNQTFEICRLREGGSVVAVSPYRFGELPNLRYGIASITAAAEAVSLYERLADNMWRRSVKGKSGAALLRQAVIEVRSPEFRHVN